MCRTAVGKSCHMDRMLHGPGEENAGLLPGLGNGQNGRGETAAASCGFEQNSPE